MEYSGKIFWSMEINIIRAWIFLYNIKLIVVRKRKNFIGDKYIESRNLYGLGAVRLLFRFGKFFGNVTFAFAGRLGDISVFAKIFHDIIIINRVVYQWQNRSQCYRENDKYGNKKFQWCIVCYKYTTEILF